MTGARTELVKNIQIDATVGRNCTTSVASLGLKIQFLGLSATASSAAASRVRVL